MSLTSMILTTDWITIILILIIAYVARFYFTYFTRPSPLPGPFPLPLIGNLHQVGLNLAKYVMDNQEVFGDMFEIRVGSKRLVILSHVSLIDQFFIPNTKSNKFFPRLTVPGLQHGLAFNDDYPSWKRSRKFVVQSLMSSRFLKQFTHLAQSLFNENEKFWDKKEYHIDLSKWIKCFTTDITLQTITCNPSYCLNTYLFGEEYDKTRYEEIKRSIKFTNAVHNFMKALLFNVVVPETLKNYCPGFYNLKKKYNNNLDWLKKTMLDIIKKRRIEIEKISNDEKDRLNLIDILLTLNSQDNHNEHVEDESPMTDQEICSTLVEIGVGGIETTGNTFCFTVWQLAHHPKVLERFQQEITEILGDNKFRQITYEDLEKFKYLDAIIKESTRIIPLAPLVLRTSSQDCIIGGKNLEADTIFFLNSEKIHNSPDSWENPEQFIPERFLKESNNEIVKNSFFPFGGGIRICPGRHMSMVELKTLLILLYRKYDVELIDKISKKPNVQYMITYNCVDMNVILRPKKDI